MLKAGLLGIVLMFMAVLNNTQMLCLHLDLNIIEKRLLEIEELSSNTSSK